MFPLLAMKFSIQDTLGHHNYLDERNEIRRRPQVLNEFIPMVGAFEMPGLGLLFLQYN